MIHDRIASACTLWINDQEAIDPGHPRGLHGAVKKQNDSL